MQADAEHAPAAIEPSAALDASPPDSASDSAQRIDFIHDYADGCRRSQASGKPMLVFFTADWCRYCHQMAAEAFGERNVVALSQNFVCVEVDADSEAEVCQQFRVQAFPTVQFVSVRGVPLNRIVGKKPSGDVTLAMQAVLQTVARRASATETESR